jgi:ribonuclease P protein component
VNGVKGTIKSANEISFFFKKAQRVSTGSFVALLGEKNKGRGFRGRVAFIAGKRLGNAPQRNRAKRLMREAVRTSGIFQYGVDVIFIAREQTAQTAFDTIVRDVETVRQRLIRRKG